MINYAIYCHLSVGNYNIYTKMRAPSLHIGRHCRFFLLEATLVAKEKYINQLCDFVLVRNLVKCNIATPYKGVPY